MIRPRFFGPRELRRTFFGRISLHVARSRRRLCPVYHRLRGRRTRKFKSPSCEGAGCEEGSEAPTSKLDRGPASEASVPSRIPGNRPRSHGRFRWQGGHPRSQWGCSRPDALQFEPCDVGNSCCLAKDKQPSVTEGSHSAWSRRRHQSQQSPGQARAVPPEGDVPPRQPLDTAEVLAKLEAVLDKPRSSRSAEEDFGVDPGVATTETPYTDVLNGGGSGGGGGGVQRLNGHAQVHCILRARHECPGALFMANETRVREDLMTLPGESWSW